MSRNSFPREDQNVKNEQWTVDFCGQKDLNVRRMVMCIYSRNYKLTNNIDLDALALLVNGVLKCAD